MRSATAAHSTTTKPKRGAASAPIALRGAAPATSAPGDGGIPLSNRAMIVRLSTSRWHAQKTDREIAREVAAAKKSEESRHRHTRLLLASTALEKVTAAFSAAAKFHHTNTSPWEDGGMRLLSNRRYTFYMEGIAKLQRDVVKAVEDFKKVYPDLVEHERKHNPSFVEADYPPVNEIGAKFGIRVIIDYLPSKDDFRVVGLDPNDNARIQADIEARTTEKVNGIVADLWKRTHECVFRISDRLKAYEEREQRLEEAQAAADRRRGENKGKLAADVDTNTGRFSDTLITNLRELIDILPDLDLTDDPGLAAMRQKMRNQLCLHETADLRQSPLLRKRVAENADKILVEVKQRLDDVSEFLA